MASLELNGTDLKKSELIKQLSSILEVLNNCPDSMIFRVNLDIEAVDPRFIEVINLILSTKKQINESLVENLDLDSDEISKKIKETLNTFKDI